MKVYSDIICDYDRCRCSPCVLKPLFNLEPEKLKILNVSGYEGIWEINITIGRTMFKDYEWNHG